MTTTSTTFPFIVADIGGTNARFGLITGERDKLNRLQANIKSTYACHEHKKFEDVFALYLELVKSHKPQSACIAIAAPITGDEVQMTNLNWNFSSKSLATQSGLNDIALINDFGALAFSTLHLQDSELITIYKDSNPSSSNTQISSNTQARAVIGPGTGLGIAGLVNTNGGWQPVCGEGGHISFAPLDERQIQLRDSLLSILGTTHISIENLISGPGLENIYKAICHSNNETEKSLTATHITTHAKDKSDANCAEALEQFTKILGASAGDIALTMGAFGGVYLSGGILPKIIDAIDKDLLVSSYLNKGVKQNLLKTIPLYLVSAPMPALTGAAHWVVDSQNR